MPRALERRQFVRYPIQVRIKLQLTDDPEAVHSQTGDLSEGGLHFLWVRELAEGTPLKVILPVLDRSFNVSGEVVYSHKDHATGLFRTGVSFKRPSSTFRVKIAEEILRIQRFREEFSKKLGRAVSEEEAARRWIAQYSQAFSEIYR